jgi:hypothetical protein
MLVQLNSKHRDELDFDSNYKVVRLFFKAAAHGTACLYPNTKDYNFLIGKSGAVRYVHTPH